MTTSKTPLLDSTSPLSSSSTIIQNYGAAGVADEEEAGPLLPKVDVKVGKRFSEIWVLCVGLWASIFCSAIAGTLVTNLQLEIATEFEAGHLASWLGSGYLLGLAALTPIYGRLTNVIGRRGTMILAMALFVVGTILCAFSTSIWMFIGARVIAGSGGGGVFTVSAIIIADLVSLANRGLYQGLVNVVITAGSATGSIIGGWIADVSGWRAAFYFQLPLLAAASGLILWKVHVPFEEKVSTQTWQEKLKRIDWLGSFVVILAVSSLMVSLSLHTSFDVPLAHPSVWGLLVVCVVSTVSFYYVEENYASEPVVPMRLLRMKTPALINVAMGFYTSTLFARMYILPIYLHVVRDLSNRLTGSVMLPSGISGSISSLFAGWYMQKSGRYKKLTIISCFPPLLSSAAIMTWGTGTNLNRLWIEMALANLGGGIMITTLLTGLIASVSHEDMAMAIAASFLFRAIGQVLGVSLAFAAQQWVLERALVERLGDASEELIRKIIHTPSTTIPQLLPAIKEQAVLAYLVSIQASRVVPLLVSSTPSLAFITTDSLFPLHFINLQSVFLFVAFSGIVILFCSIMMREFSLPGR
ncbi:vacuolar amino acid permease [Mrakia frigida]|uniref:vacuolar amino acid permease n=1 Tax=Mrakia frigida TaxID=29902 RepID=UPI003FCC0212